jgi:DNA-binding Lrp family transcriptional regulator
MSNGACILAHFADREKLIPAAAKLAEDRAVTRWDAVDGHVHLVAWSSDMNAARGAVTALDGVDRVTAYETTPAAVTVPADSTQCFAYVFVETETAKRDQVIKSLGQITEIVSTIAASGGCDIIALVGGETFSRVDAVVRDRIRPLDGVLRLKHNRIIDLRQL